MTRTDLSISVLLNNLIGLFLLIGVGFLAVRAKLVPQSAIDALTNLMLRVTLPATVFSVLLRPFEAEFVRDAIIIVLLGTGLFLAYIGLNVGLVRLFRVREGRRGIWMLCSTFCNNGFMGFPVVYALFGDEGLSLAVMLCIPFNLLLYSVGVMQASLDRRSDSQAPRFSWKGVLFSAVNLSTVAGLIFYGFQIPVPELLLMPIESLADMTTPLSMLITGMSLAGGRLRDLFRDRDAITCSCTRLVLLPLLSWAVISQLPISNPLVSSVLLVTVAMPCAAAASPVAQRYDGCLELAARAVCLSSLLSIVTLPLITMLL